MDSMDNLRTFLDAHPEHWEASAMDMEKRYKSAPDDRGIRLVFWELQRRVNKKYPIDHLRPEEIDPPEDAWDDEGHEFWKSDPFTLWDSRYHQLERQAGVIQTRILVSTLGSLEVEL